MATILLGWEIGEGFGHVARLLPVARALAALGHQPIFALSNIGDPWPLLRHEPFPVLQGPCWQIRRWDRRFVAASLADVLAMWGWSSVAELGAQVRAWQGLLDVIRPDLIVCDFSPALCLAAYRTLPVIELGNWFCMPPVDQPTYPVLAPGQTPVVPQEELLQVAQEVQRRRGKPVPPTLTGIQAAGDRFPTFLPELDPYHEVRREPVWDLLSPLPALAPLVSERSFFAYLRADNPHVEAVLTQLALTGCRGTVYLRGAAEELRARLRLQGLTVLERPAALAEMLANHAVLVHHGGGSAYAAFAAGRPQLLFPQHLEQRTTGKELRRLGVGLYLDGGRSPEAAARALVRLLDEPGFAQQARACAQAMHARPRRDPLPAILDCCRKRLARAA